jgi:hypothetical protein
MESRSAAAKAGLTAKEERERQKARDRIRKDTIREKRQEEKVCVLGRLFLLPGNGWCPSHSVNSCLSCMLLMLWNYNPFVYGLFPSCLGGEGS